MPNHKWALSITTDSGSGPVDSKTVTAPTEQNIGNKGTSTCQVAVGEVVYVAIAVTVANLASWFMESDQPMRVRFNSEVSPVYEIDLVAKKAAGWTSGLPAFFPSGNPLVTNITGLYLYNEGTAIANFQAGFLTLQASQFS